MPSEGVDSLPGDLSLDPTSLLSLKEELVRISILPGDYAIMKDED